MIRHHPDSTLLLSHAAGSLDGGSAVVVGAHLERCGPCREQVRSFEALGGAVLESIEPALMAPQALARTLARIDALDGAPARAPRADPPRPSLPDGAEWPRSLRGCAVSRWRWLGPGMRWSRVSVPHDASANVFLLRIGAGRSLAVHTHDGTELTHVLCGSFGDGRGVFGPGDFDAADGSVRHKPAVQGGGECICLTAVHGRVRFEGALARLVGSRVGL